MRYQSVIDVNNKNNSHTIAIDFIAEKAGDQKLRILDVGCSAGYLGEYFKTLGHHVTGIDINAEAIEVAKGYLDEVYCESLDTFFARTFAQKFDAVIFGDVLEHVTNSEEILKKTAQHLSPTGFVVASIPNVSHLAVRAMLLEGRWEYADLGLMDRDHLRFFTKESIHKLFADASYEIHHIKPVKLDVATVNQLCHMDLNPRFIKYAQIFTGGDDSADVFQYVTIATPHAEKATRVVAYVPTEVSSLVDIRIRGPLENWNKRFSGSLRIRDLQDVRPEDLYWGDVFIFQRVSGINIKTLIDALRRYGKKVVFEIDDLLMELPDFLSHHRLSSDDLRFLVSSLSTADAITTTTQRLADKLGEFNSNVFRVPNCIHGAIMSERANLGVDSPKATIVIASTDSVTVDILLKPVQRIKQAYGDAVQIVAIGPIARFFIKKNIPVIEYPIQGYAEFRKLLSELPNPIGIIPLDDSVFSSCKSPIKFFDYSSVGIPSLCSDVPPYSDYVAHGETGLLVENHEQAWYEAICKVVEDANLRQSLVSRARTYALETHQMDKAGDAWNEVIQGLQVERIESKELLKTINYYPGIERSMRFFLRQLLNPKKYKKVLRVLFTEGLNGIIVRLGRA
jgi:2-polyprenyl-3-methyl-5-hydroxy-6-metoxy-1,4-benzoquinol methylase